MAQVLLSDKYLEADLLIQGDGPVGEGDGVAETGLPLYCFLSLVHDNLGPLGVWVEKKRADGKRPSDAAALDRQTPLGFVVTSVRRGWKRAAERVCKGERERRQRERGR